MRRQFDVVANPDTADIAHRPFLVQQNLSQREQTARQWYQDNKTAVDAYNEMINAHGLVSDGVRTF